MLAKIVGGALLAIFGGLCNGSWLVPTKESAPAFLLVTSPDSGLPWEAFWLVFMLAALVANLVVTIASMGVVGFDAIRNSPPGDVTLVCVFFCIWGFGTTGSILRV